MKVFCAERRAVYTIACTKNLFEDIDKFFSTDRNDYDGRVYRNNLLDRIFRYMHEIFIRA